MLTELAELKGVSKASLVMEAIEFQLPSWYERRRALTEDGAFLAVNELRPSNGGQVVVARTTRQLRAVEAYARATEREHKPTGAEKEPVPMTRQQRRALERQQRKTAGE